MSESKQWVAAMKAALAIQSQLIANLNERVTKLEKQANENTQAVPNQQEVIHGITGTKYVPLKFAGPDNIPRKVYPDSEEQQRENEAVHGDGEELRVLA